MAPHHCIDTGDDNLMPYRIVCVCVVPSGWTGRTELASDNELKLTPCFAPWRCEKDKLWWMSSQRYRLNPVRSVGLAVTGKGVSFKMNNLCMVDNGAIVSFNIEQGTAEGSQTESQRV